LERIYVCSEPVEIAEINSAALAETIRGQIRTRPRSLAETAHHVLAGLENRQIVRRDRRTPPDEVSVARPSTRVDSRTARATRIARLRERARTEDDAIAAALGVEAWSLGIQMILATPDVAPAA